MSRYTSQRLSIKGMKENQVVVRNAHGRKRLFIKHANKLYSTSLYSNSKSDRVIKLIRNDLRVTGPLKVGSEGYLSLTDNEIDISSGNLTIDVAGDIALDADGGEVSFKDGEATIGEFSSASSISKLSLYSQSDKGDLFKVETTTHGATTITTIDDDATAAHLTLDVDGYITMHTNVGSDGVKFTNASDVAYAQIKFPTASASAFVLASQEDTGDGFIIQTSTNGVTTMATTDDDGAGASLTIQPDGPLQLNSATNDLQLVEEKVTHTLDVDDTTNHTTSAYTLDLDVDGIIASGQTGNNIGFNIDLNSDSPTMVGAVNNYGMDIDVVAGTSGTQINYGIDLSVTGADTNTGMRIDTTGTHLMLRYNSDDYASINVADTGDLVVATYGDGTTDSDLTLNIDGDIELNADGGDIAFKDASADLAALSSSGLTISNISEVGSDTDKFLMSDSGVVKYVTGSNLASYVGAATNHITNDAADVMTVSDFGANAALKIDADQPATALAEDSVGLHIDYDRAVATSGTAAHNDIGIDLDVNSRSLGTSSVKGMDIDVVGHTDGTHTAIGIDLDVDSADTNIGMVINTAGTHIKLEANADTNDYATFTLADTGDLTIATTGDGSADSDLMLSIDGKIELDSASNITLDSANGRFITKNNGTEFSVANSAWAGMILGYNTVGIDATTASVTLGTSFSVINANHKVKFVAPPSGVVEIFVSVFMDVNRRTFHFGLSDNSTYNTLDATHEHTIMALPGTDTDRQVNHRWVITGLTAGTAYEYWLGAKATHAFSTSMKWGGDATEEYQPFIMKATALPTAVSDYAVYG